MDLKCNGAVVELWKAGDRVLNAKMVNKGVTAVDIVDYRSGQSLRLPQCPKLFTLNASQS